MTQDDIIEMWKNSGDLEIIGMPYSKIEAFAKLVAAKEREACALIVEETDVVQTTYCMTLHDEGAETLRNAAEAIRARGEA